MGQLFVRHREVAEELLVRGRFLQGVEVLPVNILKERVTEQEVVLGDPNDCGDRAEPGLFGRTTIGCRTPTAPMLAASSSIPSSSKVVRGCLGLGSSLSRGTSKNGGAIGERCSVSNTPKALARLSSRRACCSSWDEGGMSDSRPRPRPPTRRRISWLLLPWTRANPLAPQIRGSSLDRRSRRSEAAG